MAFKKILFFSCVLYSLFLMGCSGTSSQQQEQKEEDTILPYFQHKDTYITLENTLAQPQSYTLFERIHVTLDTLSNLKISDSLHHGNIIMKLDGKAHFKISKDTNSAVIYTGMMTLKTKAVNFEIKAFNTSPGQSLKVFGGKLIATKAYKSDFPNTDTLQKGDMILINSDIDLMEKETFDTTQFKPTLSK